MFTLPLNTSNYDNELALSEACLKQYHFIIIVDHVRLSRTVILYGPLTYGQVRCVPGLLIVSHCLYALRISAFMLILITIQNFVQSDTHQKVSVSHCGHGCFF